MSRHKAYALSPRDCLKTTLFQKWQRMVAPPGKRGRRTVALHEKHQPVEPNGRPVYRRIWFLIGTNDGESSSTCCRATSLGSNRFPWLEPPIFYPDLSCSNICFVLCVGLRVDGSWHRMNVEYGISCVREQLHLRERVSILSQNSAKISYERNHRINL